MCRSSNRKWSGTNKLRSRFRRCTLRMEYILTMHDANSTSVYLNKCERTLDKSESRRVGVGIMIAHNPLHGSGQAALPHPALALGDDAHAAQGIGMTDDRHGQPASDEAPHAIPKDATFLAAPRKRAMPEP